MFSFENGKRDNYYCIYYLLTGSIYMNLLVTCSEIELHAQMHETSTLVYHANNGNKAEQHEFFQYISECRSVSISVIKLQSSPAVTLPCQPAGPFPLLFATHSPHRDIQSAKDIAARSSSVISFL